ncbi:hypothetical protein Tsubulata_018083 [Turnera subulata]|uniref:RRM domain-containing protein n=1 Tax=Turnera subulata TaxID=218843 RepID=A0A9Q0FHE7_9ROSI|nr:hypothetical protein Tsubulata_018083 [Turnera subulata]
MADRLDMSLDDIIRKNKESSKAQHKPINNNNYRGRHVSGHGPDRRPPRRDPHPHRPKPYPLPASTLHVTAPVAHIPVAHVPEPMLLGSGGGTGTKLYISNLDYDVSNQDIQVLFSEVGDLLRYSIHYDKSGRSKGTAEVIFARQADALAAIKRYNNVQLDGKPMRIEIVGVNFFAATHPTSVFPPAGATRNVIQSRGSFRSAHARIGARGHGRGFGGSNIRGLTKDQKHERRGEEKVTAEALDLDLDRYHLEAMKID